MRKILAYSSIAYMRKSACKQSSYRQEFLCANELSAKVMQANDTVGNRFVGKPDPPTLYTCFNLIILIEILNFYQNSEYILNKFYVMIEHL